MFFRLFLLWILEHRKGQAMLNYYAFLVRKGFVPAEDHASNFVEALWQLVSAILLALFPRHWLIFPIITVTYPNTLLALTPLT